MRREGQCAWLPSAQGRELSRAGHCAGQGNVQTVQCAGQGIWQAGAVCKAGSAPGMSLRTASQCAGLSRAQDRAVRRAA